MAFLDPNADVETRFDGALLVFSAIDDLALLRSVLLKRTDE